MGCRGVHFAITDEQVKKLLRAEGDEAVRDVVSEIEEGWDEDNLVESDKSWDGIHRCLTDGTLGFDNGEFPLKLAVLGGRQLHEEDDYIVCLVNTDEVTKLATALKSITEEWFRQQYFAIDDVEIKPYQDDEGFGYHWSYFQDVRKFFESAARQKKAVIFTVDQ